MQVDLAWLRPKMEYVRLYGADDKREKNCVHIPVRGSVDPESFLTLLVENVKQAHARTSCGWAVYQLSLGILPAGHEALGACGCRWRGLRASGGPVVLPQSREPANHKAWNSGHRSKRFKSQSSRSGEGRRLEGARARARSYREAKAWRSLEEEDRGARGGYVIMHQGVLGSGSSTGQKWVESWLIVDIVIGPFRQHRALEICRRGHASLTSLPFLPLQRGRIQPIHLFLCLSAFEDQVERSFVQSRRFFTYPEYSYIHISTQFALYISLTPPLSSRFSAHPPAAALLRKFG